MNYIIKFIIMSNEQVEFILPFEETCILYIHVCVCVRLSVYHTDN